MAGGRPGRLRTAAHGWVLSLECPLQLPSQDFFGSLCLGPGLLIGGQPLTSLFVQPLTAVASRPSPAPSSCVQAGSGAGECRWSACQGQHGGVPGTIQGHAGLQSDPAQLVEAHFYVQD